MGKMDSATIIKNMIWLIYILLDAFGNWLIIEKKKTVPVYAMLFIIRGMAAIAYGIFLNLQYGDWVALAKCLGFVTFTFPYLFNTTLNLLRGKLMDYVGAESGWIDSFVVRHGWQRKYFWLTLILFVVAIKYFI